MLSAQTIDTLEFGTDDEETYFSAAQDAINSGSDWADRIQAI